MSIDRTVVADQMRLCFGSSVVPFILTALVTIVFPAGDTRSDTPSGPPANPTSTAATDVETDTAEREQKLRRGIAAALAQALYPIARAAAEELIRSIEERAGPKSTELIVPLANRASACLELGDGESANRDAQRAMALVDASTTGAIHVSVLMVGGRAATALNDGTRARKLLGDALSIVERSSPRDRPTEAHIYELLLDTLSATSRESTPSVDPNIVLGNQYAGN